jgi:DNA-directed RNA polymerase I subunit RPA1
MGHISLPIPVYNVTFFDQLLRLLRATCVYCFHLRMAKAEVDRYACKLKLIQYGLLAEAEGLDNIHMKAKKAKVGASREEEGPGDDIKSEDDNDDVDAFIARRRKWTDKVINRKGMISDAKAASKVAAIYEARREVVREFLKSIISVKGCRRCQAYVSSLGRGGRSLLISSAGSRQLSVVMRSQKSSKCHSL